MRFVDHPLAHMAGGFVLMGGWAAIANLDHPMPAPLLAGIVQGSLTAVITLGLKRLVEAIGARTRGTASVLLPPLAAFGLSAATLSLVHALAATPEVLRTIAVPVAVSTTYALVWALRLGRAPHG